MYYDFLIYVLLQYYCIVTFSSQELNKSRGAYDMQASNSLYIPLISGSYIYIHVHDVHVNFFTFCLISDENPGVVCVFTHCTTDEQNPVKTRSQGCYGIQGIKLNFKSQ